MNETVTPRRFQVLAGRHIDGNQVYQQGSVVASHIDLVAKFPLKFREVPPEPVDVRPAKTSLKDRPAKKAGKAVKAADSDVESEDAWNKE